MQQQVLFTPKLSGARFSLHTVPADVLPDIAALQDMLVDLAKAAYIEADPGRSRAPRNFDANVQIHLAAIGEGSATLKLVLVFAGLFTPYQTAFEKAQTQITQAVEAVNLGQQPMLAPRYLAYFSKVGSSLLEGESLDFPTNVGYAPLNRETRQRLIQASQVEEWTERATLRVRVSMTDYYADKFSVHLPDGTVASGKLDPIIREQFADAHRAYGTAKNEWLILHCVVRKDRSGKIKGIDSVENAAWLDPLDVSLRLREFSELKDGWLDGQGRALSKEGIQWLASSFAERFSPDLSLPHLYPTPEGKVLAEWKFGRQDVSLLIDIEAKTSEYEQLHLDSEDTVEEAISLEEEVGWERLNGLLKTLTAEQVIAA